MDAPFVNPAGGEREAELADEGEEIPSCRPATLVKMAGNADITLMLPPCLLGYLLIRPPTHNLYSAGIVVRESTSHVLRSIHPSSPGRGLEKLENMARLQITVELSAGRLTTPYGEPLVSSHGPGQTNMCRNPCLLSCRGGSQ